ncbi:discoidin domain-containing protein [Zongyangia hominis]|uniref:Discoidin domain-containing protein n=1 Tax=Zongyangia hominis TaxID=2763677 RepID=A0A926EDY1_9FIRM|nr:discoidin domain-containing protein [Zongyangia hominis]MBC8571330.1 discoidin domain-containing protein [Zongyangia hominis]
MEPSEGSYDALVDNKPDTFFHSAWSVSIPVPHYLIVDTGKVRQITGIRFLHRNSTMRTADIADYRLEGSVDGNTWFLIKEGNLPREDNPAIWREISVEKAAQSARYVKLTVLKNQSGGPFFVLAELRVLTEEVKPAENVGADCVDDRRARLYWQDPVMIGVAGEAVKYHVMQGDTVIGTLMRAPGGLYEYILKGLAPDKEYTYAIVAEDEDGRLSAPVEVSFKTPSRTVTNPPVIGGGSSAHSSSALSALTGSAGKENPRTGGATPAASLPLLLAASLALVALVKKHR